MAAQYVLYFTRFIPMPAPKQRVARALRARARAMRGCAWLAWAVLVHTARAEAEGSLSAQYGDGAYKQPTWDRRDEAKSQARLK